MPVKKVILIFICCCYAAVAQTYTLTVTSDTGGTTTPSGTISVQADAPVPITAIPKSGFRFYSWTTTSLNGTVKFTQQIPKTLVTITGDATIKANFIPIGSVYEIEPTERQYNYTTANYSPTALTRVPGVAFVFIAPAPGFYEIVVEDVDTSLRYLMDFDTDSTFDAYLSYVNGNGTLRQAFRATATGEKHYFSVLINSTDFINNNFTIRYQSAPQLTVEHTGFGSTFPSGKIALRSDTATALSARTSSSVSYFDHWEVTSGKAVIGNTKAASTTVSLDSGKAVVRAVFLMYPADTILVVSDENGRTFPVDTVFVRTGSDTTLSAIPDGGHLFDSWEVVSGTASFANASNAHTSVTVSGGKATVRARFKVDPNTEPTVSISEIDISGHPDICVTASVTDTSGKSIPDLDTSFFRLYEDDTSRQFHLSTVTEAGGTSVCFVLDKSGSMGTEKMPDAISAAQSYIATMNRYDRCAIVVFDSKVRLVHEMTSDTAALNEAVGNILAGGGTSILDGADMGITQLLQETNPRSVIIFSDGQGNGNIGIDSVVNHALHNNVTIYSIGIGSARENPLKNIADSTGGYFTYAPDAAQLAEIYSDIKRSVESRYILCYESPDLVFNGDTHSVVISVSMNGTTSRDTTFWDESNKPPLITLTPETMALISRSQPENIPLTIAAEVTDDGTVQNVRLFHRITDSNVSYTQTPMTHVSDDTWSVILPADSILKPGLDFYLLAADNKNLIGKSPNILSPESAPWLIRIGGSGLYLDVVPDTVIDEGTRLEVLVTAGDNTTIAPSISTAVLPAGATFIDHADGTGVLSWSTGCNDHGNYWVIFTAKNGTDSLQATLALTVRDVNFPPRFAPLTDTTVFKNHAFTFTVKTDDCDGDVVQLAGISIPTGSVFADNGNGSGNLTWGPEAVDSGLYVTVFQASDAIASATDTVLIHVIDTASFLPPEPSQLIDGWYSDGNVDGRVDAVVLRFLQPVALEGTSVSLTWSGAKIPQSGPLTGGNLRHGPDNTTLIVTIPDSLQRANGIRTGGLMSAVVRFAAFTVSRTAQITDSAAPVIDSALYRTGAVAIGDESAPDTLSVWFSENVRLGITSTPLTFFNDTTAPFLPELELQTAADNRTVFIVKNVQGSPPPQSGDSLYINPVSAVGDSLSWQNNPANRRVCLKWALGSMITLIPVRSTGPNPLDISVISRQLGINENQGKLITVTTKRPLDTLQRNGRPVIDSKDGSPVFGTALIYDPAGNLMKSDALIKKSDNGQVYYIVWDCTNRNHRRVAPGTYLVSTTTSIDNEVFRKNQKFSLRWR